MEIFDSKTNRWQIATQMLDKPPAWEYIHGMKIKTSVTLSEDLLEAIDKRAGQFKNRSEFIVAQHILRKVAIITGGASGIGRALSQELWTFPAAN